MPALAGLLILVGCRTVKPADLASVWRTGTVQKAVLATTFVLTMVIPLQYAVLAGVGLSVILHVVRQSNQVTIKRWRLDPAGDLIETDPPASLPGNEVVALQPYGSLFFAAALISKHACPPPADLAQRPGGPPATRAHRPGHRLHGRAGPLRPGLATSSKLVIVSASDRIQKNSSASPGSPT